MIVSCFTKNPKKELIMIPQHTKQTIDDYVNHKYEPGSFVYAVLSNNLIEAFNRADDINLQYMKDIVSYVYNKIPQECWGSPKIVENWLKNK